MNAGDWIALVAAGIALIALVSKLWANRQARDSISEARKKNEYAEKANLIAKEAKDKAVQLADIKIQRYAEAEAKAKARREAQRALEREKEVRANSAALYMRFERAKDDSEPGHIVIGNNGPGDAKDLMITVEPSGGSAPLVITESALWRSRLQAGKEYRVPIAERQRRIVVTAGYSDAREHPQTHGPWSFYTGPEEDPEVNWEDVASLFSRRRRSWRHPR